ncbi:MAG TPA: cell envelope biogenesis protein TolA [Afifellaceae bacterium]|nr:cell envelope biogenesis protein TolA [Afifellaceae bacterium]
MRPGLAFSIAGHLAILAYGLVAFPNARPFKVDDIESFPVDLVPIAEMTNLAAGDRKAEKTPAAQPKPTVKAEAPSLKPAEKPAKVPVKVAEVPTPEIVAALPRPAVLEPPPAEAEPEARAPEAPPLPPAQNPRARPKPPKPVKVAKAEPKKPRPPVKPVTTAAKKPDGPSFNPDEIAALLNKQDPAGGGDPSPAAAPQTFGADEGGIDAAMTQSEQDAMIGALRNRLAQCWNPPRGVREAGSLRVTIGIGLLPDGSLAGDPRIVDAGFDPLSQIAAESALRAVQICAPYDMLPPEMYSAWRDIEFIFDPREMLGG